ncbi:MAG: hypothetical protein ACYS80_13135 [Planctomycetota bacterium]|jgi:hypothetical protein
MPNRKKNSMRRNYCAQDGNRGIELKQNKFPPAAQLMKFIVGSWISKPVYVAAEFGIADLLSGTFACPALKDATQVIVHRQTWSPCTCPTTKRTSIG